MSRSSDPVDPLDSDDPVHAFHRARDEGRLLSLRTSGTTARPRRVLRTTDSWERSFAHVSALTGIDPSSRVWVPGPTSATMNLFARVQADAVGAAVADNPDEATHAHLTPLNLDRALRDNVLIDGTPVIVAGDALPESLLVRAHAAGLTVHQYYGAAELSFVAWADDGRTLRPFPEVEITVDDDVIWARSPYLCKGYDDTDGPLRWSDDGKATVGDRGTLIDGALSVLGRGEDAVTVAGVTVLVADVESALRDHAEGQVMVVGLPDARLGSVLAAAVTDAQDVERLRAAARLMLDPAQRPSHWYVVEDLPSTPAGKPDHARIRAMLSERPPSKMAR